jgi:hypothetical protein
LACFLKQQWNSSLLLCSCFQQQRLILACFFKQQWNSSLLLCSRFQQQQWQLLLAGKLLKQRLLSCEQLFKWLVLRSICEKALS